MRPPWRPAHRTTYQREAEQDAERREVVDRVLELSLAVRATRQEFGAATFHNALGELTNCAADALLALAVAERERDQARQALREIVRREAMSDYSSIYAAPGEFAAVASAALAEEPQT